MKTLLQRWLGLGSRSTDAPALFIPQRRARTVEIRTVTADDLAFIEDAIRTGRTLPALLRKLAALDDHDGVEHWVKQRSLLLLSLAQADHRGSFLGCSGEARGGMVKALAYVWKPDDAIADGSDGGYNDDRRELVEWSEALGPLLSEFKRYRDLLALEQAAWAAQREAVRLVGAGLGARHGLRRGW